MTPKAYENIEIVPSTTVAGNIRDFTQSYKIKFYPKANDLPEKIALYIYLDSKDKSYAKRSVYFSSAEQLKELIFNLTKAYFYFRDKKTEPINREQFRLINLADFVKKLEEHQRNIWRGNTY